MMIPGDSDDWVMLDIEPGSTFLDEHVVMYAAQAYVDGPEITQMKLMHMLWAAAAMQTIEAGETVWPYEIAQSFADGLHRLHDRTVEEYGEDDLRERYGLMAAEMKRVLEQVDADIAAKTADELKRLRVRRDA